MKQEDKEPLLKDLCARLPYGTRIHISHPSDNAELDDWLTTGTIDNFLFFGSVKPYLRPMSSMTEEEKRDLGGDIHTYYTIREIDWLNAHHFDYRGLIPMGLALEAPEGMYEKD